jgi:FG-GAP-like repeat
MANLSGQVDLVSAIEGTPLSDSTDVASFTDDNHSDTSGDFTATIDWGDGVTTTGVVLGSNGSFTVQGGPHTYADDDFVVPVVTITRTADNTQLQLFGGVNVSDADNLTGHSASTIVANPNQALTNVVVGTFSDTYTGHTDASDFIVNIDWGDGTTTTGTATGSGGSFTVTGSHTYTTAGNFTITTFFNDDSPDAASAIATTQADIGFGGTEVFAFANETQAVAAGTTVATFNDNAGLTAADYTATIDWGDGTTTTGAVSGSGGSFTVTSTTPHTYGDEGLFTEVVTITRTTDNATIAPSGTVTVFDTDNFENGSGTTIHGDPNVALTNVTLATFTDTNTQNVAGDFVATVDWGDGTTTTGTISGSAGSFTVTGSHTYTQNGQDQIVVNVAEDSSDGQGTASIVVTSTALIGIAPTSGAAITATEGTAVPANTQVATFSDSNLTDTAVSFTASIDWGDGTTTAGTVVGAAGSFTVFGGPHTFADEGQDLIQTTLTRTSDNAQATATGTADVGEADVLSLTANNISGSQGTPINNAQVATFTDTYTGQVASDFQAQIDWGDGTTTDGTVSGASGSFTVTGSHTYAAPGTDQVTVTVLDDDVGSATASGTGTATIAARTLMGTMVLNAATEGTALSNTTTVATFTDSLNSDTAGDFSATIDWGDGVTTTGTVVGSNGSFTVQGGHTYADEGSDPAVVTLTHTADNAQATASGSVAVGEGDVLTGHGMTFRPKAGQPFTGTVATFSDTYTGNVPGDFTATIDWGDGTTTSGTVSGGSGTLSVSGTHTYAHAGHENVTVTLNDDAPGTATATAHSAANVSTLARNDFDGNNKSDFLLQNSSSNHPDVMVELLNGTTVTASATITAAKGTVVEAAGDFNNDGKADIVVQTSDGTPQIWLMNGTTRTSTVALTNPGSAWHVIAASDFNNDGNTDLLFQNTSGATAVWLMNGTSVVSTTTVGNPGISWHAIGAGDFNNDGNADVLFQNADNSNGSVQIWEMNGSSIIAQATLNQGSQWHAIGTGDFNGDGMSDILFQNNNGTPQIWEMNGTSILTQATLTNPGNQWHAIGTGDFNGDGMSDILYQNTDGTPLVWTMNGTSVVSTATYPNPGSAWVLKDDGPISGQGPAVHPSLPDPPAPGLAHSAPDSNIVNTVAPPFTGQLPQFAHGLPT